MQSAADFDPNQAMRQLPAPHLTPPQLAELNNHKQYLAGINQDRQTSREEEARTAPIFAGNVMTRVPQLYTQYGLLAQSLEHDVFTSNALPGSEDRRILLNVAAPWSAFICGSQGSGKSHTLSCMLENCLLSSEVGQLQKPLAGIIFHWDRFSSYDSQQVCEAAYLASAGIPVKVLVSPSNFSPMKAAYENLPGITNAFQRPTVVPMLFDERQLDVSRMLTMMGVKGKSDDDSLPLYMEVSVTLF
jgi:hypothetical protein